MADQSVIDYEAVATDLERRVALTMQGVARDAVADAVRPEVVAAGLVLALRSLSAKDKEALREFLTAVFDHLSDGASKWVGKKLLARVAAAMFSAGIWLGARKG